MVWIALGLLAFTTVMTAVASAADLWRRPRFRLLTVEHQMMVDGVVPPGSPAQEPSPMPLTLRPASPS